MEEYLYWLRMMMGMKMWFSDDDENDADMFYVADKTVGMN